jgi:hypothetical protein
MSYPALSPEQILEMLEETPLAPSVVTFLEPFA